MIRGSMERAFFFSFQNQEPFVFVSANGLDIRDWSIEMEKIPLVPCDATRAT